MAAILLIAQLSGKVEVEVVVVVAVAVVVVFVSSIPYIHSIYIYTQYMYR